MDIIPVFLDIFLRFFEHDKKYGFLIVYRMATTAIEVSMERGAECGSSQRCLTSVGNHDASRACAADAR